MNTPIKYETALILKNKGINFNGTSIFNYESKCKENDLVFIPELNIEIPESEWTDDLCFPTIAEIVMWIFKEYNIWIYAMPLKSGNVGFSIWNSKTDEYELERVEYKSIQEA